MIESRPNAKFGEWSHNRDAFFGGRVFKTERTGMQANRAVGVGAFVSVFEVSFYDATHTGELTPDLVMAPSLEFNF